jgi:hypothetical protein
MGFAPQGGDEFVGAHVAFILIAFLGGEFALCGFGGELLNAFTQRPVRLRGQHGFLFAWEQELEKRMHTTMEGGLSAHSGMLQAGTPVGKERVPRSYEWRDCIRPV